MTRKPRNTPARAAATAVADQAAARRSAAAHLREAWQRYQMRPGFAASTSHVARMTVEDLIQALEDGA